MKDNQALVKAARTGLKHAAPFKDAELAAFKGPLVVVNAESLEGIEAFESLEELIVFASTAEVDPIASLSKLRTLRVAACSIDDIEAIAECGALEELELNFTFVDDYAPILQLKQLARVRLLGNHCSDESYSAIVSKLRKKRGLIVEASSDADHEVNRKLAEKGIDVCFDSYLDLPVAVWPGIAASKGFEVDFVEADADAVEEQLAKSAQNEDAAKFLKGLRAAIGDETPFQTGVERFTAQYVAGNAADAKQWVDGSSLSAKEKKAFAAFIKSFDGEVFYRETEAALNRAVAARQIEIPPWIAESRRVLAGIGPQERYPWLHFATFQNASSPRIEGDAWYKVGYLGASGNVRTKLFKTYGIFPIGQMKADASGLAVNLRDGSDQHIYEFRTQDLLSDEDKDGGTRYPVFDSYAEMLGHVDAIKLGDKEVGKGR